MHVSSSLAGRVVATVVHLNALNDSGRKPRFVSAHFHHAHARSHVTNIHVAQSFQTGMAVASAHHDPVVAGFERATPPAVSNRAALTELEPIPYAPCLVAVSEKFAEHLGRTARCAYVDHRRARRSEEHTSELQSQSNLVCRLLLEKKK